MHINFIIKASMGKQHTTTLDLTENESPHSLDFSGYIFFGFKDKLSTFHTFHIMKINILMFIKIK